jgi:two-component system response regulator
MPALDDVEILLVEDNPQDAEMTIRALRKGNFHNELHWVKDGVEALEFVRCMGAYASRKPIAPIKLVLLDIKMPRMGGLDVLRELKGDDRTHGIPIVMMTSSHQDRDIVDSDRLGANGFVTKPVQLAAFMETVASIGHYWLLANQSESG